MTVINTNVKSLISQNALGLNNRALASAMEQLSTGKRINSAADDAAGLAISSRMTAQIDGLNQAVRNANDGISLIQTAEGALIEVTNMLQRMRELAVQSANDTNTPEDRVFLNLEFQQLKAEINRIADMTEWNGTQILNKTSVNQGTFTFQVGARKDQTISLSIPDFRTTPATAGTPINSTGTVSPTIVTPGTAYVAPISEISGQRQVDTITIDGSLYKAGDTITLSINDRDPSLPNRSVSYTVLASDIVTGNASQTANNIAFGIRGKNGIDVSLDAIVSGSNNTVTLARYFGESFQASVSTTVTDGGDLSIMSSTTGTGASIRDVKTVTLSGTYSQGDKIDFSLGTANYSYVVPSDGMTNANIASAIAVAMDGALGGSTVEASTGGVLTFTSTEFGTGNLSSFNASETLTGSASISTTTTPVASVPGVPATPAAPEVSQIQIQGSFFAGDVVSLQAYGSTVNYTVTASDVASNSPLAAIGLGISQQITAAGVPFSNIASNTGTLTLTGKTDGSASGLSLVVTRADVGTEGTDGGKLESIHSITVLTQEDAGNALGALDEAMDTVNAERANMGAVINRLTYAGDNLANVSQNTTESRSRILDADYAKASSELARTQIIQQAATAVLAQANMDQQSVLKLLQG